VFSFYAFKENRLSLFIKVSTLLFEGLFIDKAQKGTELQIFKQMCYSTPHCPLLV